MFLSWAIWVMTRDDLRTQTVSPKNMKATRIAVIIGMMACDHRNHEDKGIEGMTAW